MSDDNGSGSVQKYRAELPKRVRQVQDRQDSFDLKRLREDLRGGYLSPTTPRKAPAAGPPQSDLLSSLATKLSKVELECSSLRTLLQRSNAERDALRARVDALQHASVANVNLVDEAAALRSYVGTLQDQIYDMELFLDQNGLVYVDGCPSDAPEGRASSVSPAPAGASKPAGAAGAATVEAPSPGGNAGRDAKEPIELEYEAFKREALAGRRGARADHTATAGIDEQLQDLAGEEWAHPSYDMVQHNIAKMNRVVDKEKVVRLSGRNSSLADKESIPVRFYPNGIFVQRGPFRSFAQEAARAFVEDLAAGYLPSEFRLRFPNGVHIDASFENDPFEYAKVESFSGEGRRLDADAAAEDGCAVPHPAPSMGVSEALQKMVGDCDTASEVAQIRAAYVSKSQYGQANQVHNFHQLRDDRANLEKPMPAERFLQKLSGRALRAGVMIDVRASVGALIGGEASPRTTANKLGKTILIQEVLDESAEGDASVTPEASVAADNRIATLRVRVNSLDKGLNDQHMILKLPFSTAIAAVIAKIGTALGVDAERITLVRSFGGSIMDGLSRTLEECGCTPNARIFAKIGV